MATPVDLRTARLLLSIPVESDVDAVTAACQDPEVQRWTTVPSPYGRADAAGFVGSYVPAGWASGTKRTWAIRRVTQVDAASAGPDDAATELVGMIGIEGIADGAGELGYWLAAAARRDRVMSEAIAAVVRHGFDPAGADLERIHWRALAGNVASARSARRAGFRFTGARPLPVVDRSGETHEWTAELLRTDPRTPPDGWPAAVTSPAR